MTTATLATLSPKDVHERLNAPDNRSILIDVRSPTEYREVHAAGAQLMPLPDFDAARVAAKYGSDPDAPIYLICRQGDRAKKACEQLHNAGCETVYCVEGGTLGWINANLPVERDRSVISLERQVRIAAGALVLLGAILAWLVHPALILISAFVGAGLMFAGITDTCGMAKALMLMPWNRKSCAKCAS